MWWYKPLILVLRRQRQMNLCEIKSNLAYIVSSRPSVAIGRPYLKPPPLPQKRTSNVYHAGIKVLCHRA